MDSSAVLFYSTTAEKYHELSVKKPTALYFLTDTGEIYRGDIPFSFPHRRVMRVVT